MKSQRQAYSTVIPRDLMTASRIDGLRELILALMSATQTKRGTNLRVAIPSEGVRVAFCSEIQKATFL